MRKFRIAFLPPISNLIEDLEIDAEYFVTDAQFYTFQTRVKADDVSIVKTVCSIPVSNVLYVLNQE